jgi:hypothetical protein
MPLNGPTEEHGAEVEDHRVKGHPRKIQVRAQTTCARELLPLSARKANEGVEELERSRVAFDDGSGRILQRVGMLADEFRDAIAQLLEGVSLRREWKVRERRGDQRDDVRVDGVAQGHLGGEVMLDEPGGDACSRRDASDRGRFDSIPREALQRGVADAGVAREVRGGDVCRHTAAAYTIRIYVIQYTCMGQHRSPPLLVIERSPGDVRGTTFALWSWGPARADAGEILVSVTDFEVVRARDLPSVYAEGLRLRRSWPSITGAVGMWLWAKPLHHRSGSVSLWRSEADLLRFVRWPRHVETMHRYRHAGEITSTSWRAERFDAWGIWATAAARLSGDDPELAHRKGTT